ncbi:MAG: DMT family transporter [Caldilineaceae bacterium]
MIEATIVWGLLSACSWGIGDFCGGLATRRTSVWTVVLYSQGVGMVLLLLLAIGFGEALPRTTDLAWGMAAGLAGVVGLTALYQAMAWGQMALVAPLTAVIALSIPVILGILWEGMPSALTLGGFLLAAVSVMLIAYSPQAKPVAARKGLLIALIAGLGFGGFFVLIAQTQDMAIFWPLVAARFTATVALTGLIAWQQRAWRPATRQAMLPITLAGLFDAGGNALFVLAEQAGRLDIASTLSSLYPVSTVLLALLLLRERISLVQGIGVLLALAAIPLLVA